MRKKFKYILNIVLILAMVFTMASCLYPTKKDEMELSNKNTNESTIAVYNYICENYENHIISGQQESTWVDGPDYEFDYIKNITGKYPAIRGLDFMADDFDGVVERSISWWNKGGLVSICWHCGPNFTGNYDNCKNDEIENWNEIFIEGSETNIAFMENMDHAGAALKQLQDAGVTVLWRPFHEFDGAWFWWGKGGSDNFKKLWIMMYNHFTNDLKLNNLIWVLGYSHNGELYHGKPAEWYPGDAYCDIVGADTYEVSENGAEPKLYKIVKKITKGRKPLIMHECGLIPTIEQFKEIKWGAFMTWHTEWLIDTNTPEHLKQIYNNNYVITLEDLQIKK